MWPQLKHNSFSWKNCLLASIVLMTFTCVYLVLSFTKDTGRVPFLSSILMLLPFQSYTSTVSGCITYFASFQPLLNFVYQGLHNPVLPIFFSLHNIRPHLYMYPKACWLHPLSAMHLNFCSRSHKIPESSSN